MPNESYALQSGQSPTIELVAFAQRDGTSFSLEVIGSIFESRVQFLQRQLKVSDDVSQEITFLSKEWTSCWTWHGSSTWFKFLDKWLAKMFIKVSVWKGNWDSGGIWVLYRVGLDLISSEGIGSKFFFGVYDVILYNDHDFVVLIWMHLRIIKWCLDET